MNRLFGPPIPEYVLVGQSEPQTQIRVRLHGLGEPLDVTRNCVIVSLRPLLFAIGFEVDDPATTLERTPLWLTLDETHAPGRTMGRIDLRFLLSLSMPDCQIALFETTGQANYCLPPLALGQYYLRDEWHRRRHPTAYNFQMSRPHRYCHYIFYICPRPVVLVTVTHEGNDNIFPMDVMGPIRPGYYLMALRSTSPSVRLMRGSRRMALSSMPVEAGPVVYELGKHHKKERIEWADLPIATRPSAQYGLRVPEQALAVREVEVQLSHTIGSHALFITTIAHSQDCNEASRMHHISGLYQSYLKRQERPL